MLDRKGQGKGSPQKPPVTFADVAGVNQAKEELMEAVMCLRDATRYSKLNAQMPSGVLLAGPPGTGKTLLAKAVAGEAGTPVRWGQMSGLVAARACRCDGGPGFTPGQVHT